MLKEALGLNKCLTICQLSCTSDNNVKIVNFNSNLYLKGCLKNLTRLPDYANGEFCFLLSFTSFLFDSSHGDPYAHVTSLASLLTLHPENIHTKLCVCACTSFFSKICSGIKNTSRTLYTQYEVAGTTLH